MVVVLRDNVWKRRIKALFEEAYVIKCEDAFAMGCRLSLDVWLCDVEPQRGMKIFGELALSKVWILSCRRFRQTCPTSHSYQLLTTTH